MLVPRIVISTQCEFCGSVYKHNFDFVEFNVKTHMVSYTRTCRKCYQVALKTQTEYRYRLMTTLAPNWINFVDYYSPLNLN